MGNRASISIKSIKYKMTYGGESEEEIEWSSPSLFRHWNGSPDQMIKLVERAFEIMRAGYRHCGEAYPNETLALLTFLSVLENQSNSYIGIDKDDGDNSDNGHYTLVTGQPHTDMLHWCLHDESHNKIWERHAVIIKDCSLVDDPIMGIIDVRKMM